MKMTGIYIHIPYCKSRCIYCDFVSTSQGQERQLHYLRALEQEITQRCGRDDQPHARTIYIGGGTPSQLSPKAFERLMQIVRGHFAFSLDTEFTIEANPDDVTPEFVAMLQDSPVNRVSMGVQSLNDDILHFLSRRHTADQALEAVERLQTAGYTNLSLDLIYGLPGQSLSMFCEDVQRILFTGAPHLSAYALQFEPGTALWAMRQRDEVEEADEEFSLQCYQSLIDQTLAAGLEHYEISNFARQGFRSQHNSSYWQGFPYLGFGAGAHSYDGQHTRLANTSNVQAYIQGENITEEEHLSREELYDERVMLSLRTSEGLSLTRLAQDFGPDLQAHCLRQAQPHLAKGTLKQAGETLCLTRLGLFISDAIITDLLA